MFEPQAWAKKDQWRVRAACVLAATALKLALVPAYHSTDFEVHRNWLAITSSLPLRDWYTSEGSEWTLDYPPIFAWFELLLAQVAHVVDPAMLQVNNLNYASAATVIFQRSSVIVTDFILVSGAWFASRRLPGARSLAVFVLIVAHPGLIIVDHIHFQYNGMLLGILVWSIALIQEGHHLLGALLFAVLVNMKHLFASLGPLYALYLLRTYCRGPHAVARFAGLGALVAAVCGASFGPFIALGQLPQVLARLFPFGRGLNHAYWAANAWALYTLADKLLARALHRASPTASSTGGVVGQVSMAVLPDVTPLASAGLSLAAMLPALAAVWRRPQAALLPRAVAYVTMCSFMLGYHVHEKAILTVLIPMALYATDSRQAARHYLLLATFGTCALFPLLYGMQEYPIKVALLLLYFLMTVMLLEAATASAPQFREVADDVPAWERSNAKQQKVPPAPITQQRLQNDTRAKTPQQFAPADEAGSLLPALYVVAFAGLGCIEVYGTFVHPWLAGGRYKFVPLLLMSCYCALGTTAVWLMMAMSMVQTIARPKLD